MVSSYQLAWLNWIVKLRGTKVTKEREAATVIQTSSCRVPNETSQAGCMTNPKTAAFCHMCFSHYVIFGSKTTYIGKYTHPMGIIFVSLEVETIKNVNIPHWDHHLGPHPFTSRWGSLRGNPPHPSTHTSTTQASKTSRSPWALWIRSVPSPWAVQPVGCLIPHQLKAPKNPAIPVAGKQNGTLWLCFPGIHFSLDFWQKTPWSSFDEFPKVPKQKGSYLPNYQTPHVTHVSMNSWRGDPWIGITSVDPVQFVGRPRKHEDGHWIWSQNHTINCLFIQKHHWKLAVNHLIATSHSLL